jgi:L-amino acid N-acyltransferase YncA
VLQLWAAADNPESRRVEEEAGFTRQAAVNDCGEEFGRRVDAVFFSMSP